MQWTGQKIMFDLRKQIFRHIQSQDVAFFDRNPVGRLVTRVTSDVDALNEMFTAGIIEILGSVMLLVAIVGIMLWMSWPLALLTLSVIPVIFLAHRHLPPQHPRLLPRPARRHRSHQHLHPGVRLRHERRAALQPRAPRLPGLLRRQPGNKIAWTNAIFAYSLYYPIVELLSSCAIALVLWRGGAAVLHNLGFLHAHGLATGTAPGHLRSCHHRRPGRLHPVRPALLPPHPGALRQIQHPASRHGRRRAHLQAPRPNPHIISPPHPSPPVFQAAQPTAASSSRTSGSPTRKLTTESAGNCDISHSRCRPARRPHPNGLLLRSICSCPTQCQIEWILRDVSFTIEPNETAAIVGHTGAGKTTITGLMMRFYDIQRGQILVDGIDVRDQDLTALRQRFGVVLQDPFLFSGTIADNIRLGTARITPARLETAADEVNVGDFIRTLPLAFNEPVRERGAGLSTGQKQLISFARALAHDPGILILDEATSSVDTETELRVRQALTRMITGRTSVLIAHRLSTIQSADTILVMHKGQLREQGTHQQLLARHGLYYKLYQLQYQDQEVAESKADWPLL